MRGGEREGGRDDGTIGTIITDYTASPVQRRSCHLVISEGQSSVFTSPSPASWACDADSCDNVGVFGGKMTPLSFVSTADYVPTLPLLMILYWCVTKVWNICWPTPQIVSSSLETLIPNVSPLGVRQTVSYASVYPCYQSLLAHVYTSSNPRPGPGSAALCSRHAADTTREERMSVTGDFLQCDIISLLHHFCVGDIITDI